MKMRKILASACALALTAAIAVGGTLAYLTSQDTVTNTFTVGKVGITLDEAVVDVDGEYVTDINNRDDHNAYKLMPGHEYTKDPTIHVAADSEESYLFVKVVNGIADIEADGDTTIAAQMAAKGWYAVENVDNVYYYGDANGKKIVQAGENKVVFDNFTIANDANTTGYEDDTITITAYAVQADGFADSTPAQIWTAANFT